MNKPDTSKDLASVARVLGAKVLPLASIINQRKLDNPHAYAIADNERELGFG